MFGSRVIAPGSQPAFAPGEATRRYLQALAARGDRWYRLQQAEAGLVVHRAALAASALGLAPRIHYDGTNPATDAALGVRDPLHGLSFLLLGTSRPGSTVTGPLW